MSFEYPKYYLKYGFPNPFLAEKPLNILIHISSASIILPMIISLMRVKFLRKPYYPVVIYVWVTGFVEAAAKYVKYGLHESNNLLYNCQTILEFTLISLIFYYVFDRDFLKKGILLLITLFIPIALVLIVENPFYFNENLNGTSGLLLILITLTYFYRLLQNMSIPILSHSAMFWISSGVLLYFSGTIFVYIFSSVVFENNMPLWSINLYLNILFHIMLTIGIWQIKE